MAADLAIRKGDGELSAEPHVLAVDVGSSSVRAGLYRAGGDQVPDGTFRLGHELRHGPAGAADLDPDALFDRVVRAVDAAEEAARSAGLTVAAVATTTMWHSLCGVDATGEVTVPVLSWADRRSAEAAERLRGRVDDLDQHARTGCRVHTSYLPAKLTWLAEARPDAVERTARWLSPGEFVYRRLFGEAQVSVSMASGTGLLNQHTCAYDEQILAALPVRPEQLSTISDEPVDGLPLEWRRRWPALADVPWFPAIGDGAASNVGVGCVDGVRLAVMIGTSGAVRMLRADEDEFAIPPELWCYRLDRERHLLGGAVNDGGSLLDWWREALRFDDRATVEREVAALPPAEHGLTMLPLFAGERSPGWHDTARGTVAGLTAATKPGELLRAAMEAVAATLVRIVEDVDRACPADREVIGTGAALSGSATWRQILADLLGRPVTTVDVAEASSRGAAVWALHRLGVLPGLDAAAPGDGDRTLPRSEAHEAYQRLRRDQDRLYELLF